MLMTSSEIHESWKYANTTKYHIFLNVFRLLSEISIHRHRLLSHVPSHALDLRVWPISPVLRFIPPFFLRKVNGTIMRARAGFSNSGRSP